MTALPIPANDTALAEMVTDNHLWAWARPRLSICVPVYRTDASALISALSQCNASALAELIIYDDGGADETLTHRLVAEAHTAAMPVRIVTAEKNKGRAAARNRAIAHARADWLLLLDADMWPDSFEFINAYVEASEAVGRPALVVGGYSLRFAPTDRRYRLHRWQSLKSECLPAAARRAAPGRYVFTSNVMAHRKLIETCAFDETYKGWGWEDTDWGLRCEKLGPVLHIDNTATHMGLDTADALMTKYARSGENFAKLAQRHHQSIEQTALWRAANLASEAAPVVRKLVRGVTHFVARDPMGVTPVALRGLALKTWRALVYAEHV